MLESRFLVPLARVSLLPARRVVVGAGAVGLADPLILPPREGRAARFIEVVDAGGAMEGLLGLPGGSIDFRGAEMEGVPVRLDVLEVAEEPSCLVGDLLGD